MAKALLLLRILRRNGINRSPNIWRNIYDQNEKNDSGLHVAVALFQLRVRREL